MNGWLLAATVLVATMLPLLLVAARAGLLARSALACLVAGVGFLNVADGAWAHAVGVVALLAFVVLAFFAAIPALVAPDRLPRHG